MITKSQNKDKVKLKGFYLGCFLMVSSLVVKAQDATINTIKTKFESFSKGAVQEKLYLHLDRSLYIVGETIWFKAYVINGATNQDLDMSKVAYLEILDKENTAVAQTKFAVSHSRGDGSLIIPSNIASGTYKIRSYTNWMKNFGPDFFFEANVTIVNSFVAFDPNPDKDREIKYDLQFFPEGGNLVAGIESKVAFRGTDTNGLGVDFSGEIRNNNNEIVVAFQPNKFGIGRFSFKAKASESYQATFTDSKGNIYSFSFPKVAENGVVMEMQERNNGINIHVQKSENTDIEALYLIAHTRQSNFIVEKIKLTNNEGTVTLDKQLLGDGISQLTLVDQNLRPICERLYFKYPASNLDIAAKVGKPIFNTREKVTLNIATSEEGTLPSISDLSLAVFGEDDINGNDPVNIASYLLLSSDLKGNIESPDQYFNPKNTNKTIEMDNLMLTHGWRRFQWNNVFNNRVTERKFLPEYHGHFIKGILTSKQTGGPALEKELFLAAPDFPARLYTTYSERKGAVRFEVKDFFGPKELTVQTNLNIDSTSQFQIENPFSNLASSKPFSAFKFDKNNQALLLTRTINMQTGNSFLPLSFLEGDRSINDTLAFFGKPDESYALDDFTRFPTMEEVFREYVRGVLVRKKQKKFHFRMVDKLIPNTIYDTDPMVLLDGIPIFDIDKIMQFDPLKIKKIELMDGKYFMGSMAFNGIVSMTTYRNDLAGFELNPHIQVIPYEGIQYHREFYSPKYESATQLASRIPDFRNLLYWNPKIITDVNGKAQLQFYTSDQVGKYRIVIQGMSKNGNFGSHSFSFDVDKKGI